MRNYIYLNKKKNRWVILKCIQNVLHYFGCYDNIKDAEKEVKKLIKNHWNGVDQEHTYFYRYICLDPKDHSRYIIYKKLNDNKWFEEYYTDLRQALSDRDFFEECNWDINAIADNYDSKKPNKYEKRKLPILPKRLIKGDKKNDE